MDASDREVSKDTGFNLIQKKRLAAGDKNVSSKIIEGKFDDDTRFD